MSVNACVRVTARALFSGSQCEQLISSIAASSWHCTSVRSSDQLDGTSPQRKGSIASLADHACVDPIKHAILTANREDYGFAAQGFDPADPMFCLRYESGDHFAWHADNSSTDAPLATRKLSAVIQLSPPDSYEGGDLELAMYAPDVSGTPQTRSQLRARGLMITFPSYMLHRVAPVTSGVRHSIVAWLHGPAFR